MYLFEFKFLLSTRINQAVDELQKIFVAACANAEFSEQQSLIEKPEFKKQLEGVDKTVGCAITI